jgi:hypothetical protein
VIICSLLGVRFNFFMRLHKIYFGALRCGIDINKFGSEISAAPNTPYKKFCSKYFSISNMATISSMGLGISLMP